MIAYAVSHPRLSEPLILESEVERTDRALAAWASMYVLREFDEMMPPDEWTVAVKP